MTDKLDIIVDALITNCKSNVIQLLWNDIKSNNLKLNPFDEIKILENLPNKCDEKGSILFDNKYNAWKEYRGIK